LATNDGIEKIKQIKKSIGLLVIAAGIEVNGAFEKNLLKSELKVIQINVVATLQLTHHFSKAMVDKKGRYYTYFKFIWPYAKSLFIELFRHKSIGAKFRSFFV
jgi:hypothetical protein